jgi:replicative DNA helicase
VNKRQDNPSGEDDITQEQIDQAVKLGNSLSGEVSKAIRRQAAGQDFDAEAIRVSLRQAYQSLIELLPVEPQEQRAFSPLDLMASYWQQQTERKEMAATPFGSLNKALSGGLERDRLYVLLGAPGSGKTTLANQIADHVGRDRPVLYVSSEDTPMMLLAKTIARRGLIDYSAVLRGYPSEGDRINAAFAEYREMGQARNIRYVDATQGISLQEIAEQAESHFDALREQGKGDPVIVVDYLQRLARAEDMIIREKTSGQGSLGNDARQAATVYTERLRALACDLHCSVVCLSAMSRASGYSATSSSLMSAAKESGDIEYTADVILAIGEQQSENGPIILEPGSFAWCVTIAKNRQGMNSATGAKIALTWLPSFQQFIEREYEPESSTPEETASNGNGRTARRAKK